MIPDSLTAQTPKAHIVTHISVARPGVKFLTSIRNWSELRVEIAEVGSPGSLQVEGADEHVATKFRPVDQGCERECFHQHVEMLLVC